MTEEKDFWINKAEVGILNGIGGTEYKVTQETMNKRGWYKLADDEQIVKKAVLSKEEAEWFEKYKDLPFYECASSNHFISKLFDKLRRYYQGWEKRADFFKRQTQAYFNGYTIEKEKKYYIKLGFGFSKYLNVKEDGDWWFTNETPTILGRSQFTQDEIDAMQKDERAKGIDLNALKVKVPNAELAE